MCFNSTYTLFFFHSWRFPPFFSPLSLFLVIVLSFFLLLSFAFPIPPSLLCFCPSSSLFLFFRPSFFFTYAWSALDTLCFCFPHLFLVRLSLPREPSTSVLF